MKRTPSKQLGNIRAEAPLKLTFDGDGESPYMMDEVKTIKSLAWIEPSRHVYVLPQYLR